MYSWMPASTGATVAGVLPDCPRQSKLLVCIPTSCLWDFAASVSRCQGPKRAIPKGRQGRVLEHRFTTGDVVRATKEMTFAYDGEEKKVSVGDLGELVSIEQD